ncbi:PEP/pyruvate-binding domain-containing protein [Pelosinus propionicus]|uniref:Pyruvate, water dikinase n=1 Tax=Pelosinus propionicus DSM 13327 TaxID=1123291 RepID=A0A1I4NU58_9FIRM|nr:PEP/pyruvate-binding domain-containing protein [Pelosinus propionicus]SFM19048.1 pyruvate, water dikinase [Pelosinus propionicus DSM 13327]
MSKYTNNLTELNKDSLAIAGGKGANLGVLIQAGLPVPSGFVVTVEAYRAHLEAANLKEPIKAKLENIAENDISAITEASQCISTWIEESPMPNEVQEDVKRAYASFSKELSSRSDLLVAVRSSATAEDLPSASFAGQHETYLGICRIDEIIRHIKKCWASLWSSQAISYRISMGFEHLKVDLAVVVQLMIDAEAAGVMFTANPVNGRRDEMLISAGYGLGEAIVSGQITPDTFILSKSGSVKERILGSKEIRILLTQNGTVLEEVPIKERKEFCLSSCEFQQLTDLAKAVEQHYGCPMDTEWALSQGKIYMLQARPITTELSVPEDTDILGPDDQIVFQGKKAPWGLQSAMEHCSEPPTPLDFAYLCSCYQGFDSYLYNEVGFSLPKSPMRPVERESGCVAIDLKQAGFSLAMLWKVPKLFIKEYTMDIRFFWQSLSNEIDLWIKRMDEEGENTTDAVKLAKLINQAVTEMGILFQKRISDFVPNIVIDLKFDYLVKKAVGKKRKEEMKENLLKALPFRTALQNKSLVKVAHAAALYGKDSTEFKNEFNAFLAEYGDRPSASMAPTLSAYTWREKPEVVYNLIDSLLTDNELFNSEASFKKQEIALEEAKNEIKKLLNKKQYDNFLKILDLAREGVIIREEGLFYIEKLTSCVRRLSLQLGSMLKEKGILCEANDIFFLFLEELGPFSAGKLDRKEKIAKRQSAYKKVYAAHEKGIHWMISTGSFPVFHKKEKQAKNMEDPNEIKGISASRGVYEGPVCIVRGPSEFHKLKKGDILVSPYTAPVWTPLFRLAYGVVTEIGSAGSHAAIVSREYGIPCVVDIPNITNIVKDGQMIRVDGTNGIITVLA